MPWAANCARSRCAPLPALTAALARPDSVLKLVNPEVRFARIEAVAAPPFVAPPCQCMIGRARRSVVAKRASRPMKQGRHEAMDAARVGCQQLAPQSIPSSRNRNGSVVCKPCSAGRRTYAMEQAVVISQFAWA